MKDTFSVARSLLPACFMGVGVCIFAGVLVSFRLSETAFADASDLVRSLSFGGARFLTGFKRAVVGDLIFCTLTLVLSAGFLQKFFLGVVLGAKCFFAGAVAGLAAKCLVFGEALRVCGMVFASNFLVLPLYVLLFVSALSFFGLGTYCARSANARECGRLIARVMLFFVLMCLAQLVQTAVGICFVNIGR